MTRRLEPMDRVDDLSLSTMPASGSSSTRLIHRSIPGKCMRISSKNISVILTATSEMSAEPFMYLPSTISKAPAPATSRHDFQTDHQERRT